MEGEDLITVIVFTLVISVGLGYYTARLIFAL